MRSLFFILLLGFATISCISPDKKTDPAGKIGEIKTPSGYYRKPIDPNSFAAFLRGFELSRDNTVYYYDGRKKPDQGSHYAVLKMEIGNQDLLQCADAIMKLRMLYLKANNQSIAFYDNNNNAYKSAPPYNEWNNYMYRVFSMCGTMSLSKQLKSRNISNLEIGDVLIKGGFPGHAEIVVDVVENNRGHKKFMLAQGYMPAQSMHIVTNLNDNGSPWFDEDDAEFLTSGYTFNREQLKTW